MEEISVLLPDPQGNVIRMRGSRIEVATITVTMTECKENYINHRNKSYSAVFCVLCWVSVEQSDNEMWGFVWVREKLQEKIEIDGNKLDGENYLWLSPKLQWDTNSSLSSLNRMFRTTDTIHENSLWKMLSSSMSTASTTMDQKVASPRQPGEWWKFVATVYPRLSHLFMWFLHLSILAFFCVVFTAWVSSPSLCMAVDVCSNN